MLLTFCDNYTSSIFSTHFRQCTDQLVMETNNNSVEYIGGNRRGVGIAHSVFERNAI